MEVAPDKGAVRLTSPPVAVGLARRPATRHARVRDVLDERQRD